jgi:hypothetical protein
LNKFNGNFLPPRFFILENGILTYGKTAADIRRGNVVGRIDVGLSVISAKTELFRVSPVL